MADKVKLEPKPLSFNIDIMDKGQYKEENILLESEILSTEIGFGSYNLVKGIAKNTQDYYNAVTLQLAVPKEIEIEGRNRRTILLGPKEVRETYWIVKVANSLNSQFSYNFPAVIYSEKNSSVQDGFMVQNGKSVFSKDDVEKLTIKDEEKSYSRKVAINCDYKSQLKLGEEGKVSCAIKNEGNTNLKEINFCVDKVCEVVNLDINQQKTTEITVKGEQAGWNKVVVSATNTEIEKKKVLEYMVNDEPSVNFIVDVPTVVKYGETIPIKVKLEKKSFSAPMEIKVLIEGTNFDQKWQLDKLIKEEKLELQLENVPLSKTNDFVVTVSWKDNAEKEYSDKKEIVLTAEANGFVDNIKMFLNGIMSYFS